MKKIKVLLQVTLVMLLVLSCTKNEEEKINLNETNNKKLSLNTFETLKGKLIDINDLNKNALLRTGSYSRLEQNNHILSQVNDFYGTNINYDDSLKKIRFNWRNI